MARLLLYNHYIIIGTMDVKDDQKKFPTLKNVIYPCWFQTLIIHTYLCTQCFKQRNPTLYHEYYEVSFYIWPELSKPFHITPTLSLKPTDFDTQVERVMSHRIQNIHKTIGEEKWPNPTPVCSMTTWWMQYVQITFILYAVEQCYNGLEAGLSLNSWCEEA